MPDQSRAADEHAILQEITAPLASLPDDPLPSPEDTDFPRVRRGYDPLAVDAYVRRTNQLIADLQARRSPDAAVRRALERVGEQISGILQRAHDTAEQITSQSRAEAEDRLEQARQEAREVAAAGEQRVKDLDADADRIWAERLRIVEDARELAAQLTALADAAAARFPPADDTTGGMPALGGVAAAAESEPADETTDTGDAVPPPPLFDAEAGDEEVDPDATAVLPAVDPAAAEPTESATAVPPPFEGEEEPPPPPPWPASGEPPAQT